MVADIVPLFLAGWYGIGIVFAAFFLATGMKQVGGGNAPLRVRLLWLPACIQLWPLVLSSWVARRATGLGDGPHGTTGHHDPKDEGQTA